MKTAKEQTEARLSPRPKRAFLCCQEGKEGGRVIGYCKSLFKNIFYAIINANKLVPPIL